MAEFEVFGVRKRANPNEKTYQAQYEYYKSGKSKIKNKQNDVASAALWCLRSPVYIQTTGFWCVRANGTVGMNNANDSRGVAPVFLV